MTRMLRSTARNVVWLVLALLGAPVVMHVVIHDLHDHHEARSEGATAEDAHGDHEHPIVGAPLPNAVRVVPTVLPVQAEADTPSPTVTRAATSARNLVTVGALRMDDDVGLQSLLSTFLI